MNGETTLNKTELIAHIAEKHLMTKVDADKVVQTFLETIRDEAKNGDGLTIVGFGTFKVKEKPAREGRNPKTGETVHIPAKRVLHFKPSPALNKEL